MYFGLFPWLNFIYFVPAVGYNYEFGPSLPPVVNEYGLSEFWGESSIASNPRLVNYTAFIKAIPIGVIFGFTVGLAALIVAEIGAEVYLRCYM